MIYLESKLEVLKKNNTLIFAFLRWERGDRILMGNCFYFRMVSGASPLSQAEDEWFYVHCFPQRASDKWWADPCPL